MRRLYRITALILWSIICAIWSTPYHFMGWEGLKKLVYLSRLWARGIVRIVNLRIKIFGEINESSAGLVVSNHLSYVDIIVNGSEFLIRHSAKKEVGRWPFLGWFLALSHPVWIDRTSRSSSRQVLQAFVETVQHGISLTAQPEGTTSDGGQGILPFKSTIFEAAAQGNFPIFPVLINYPEKLICWHGKMTLIPHLWKILAFPSIDAELHCLAPIYPKGRNRKELASYVHGLMSREYGIIQSCTCCKSIS